MNRTLKSKLVFSILSILFFSCASGGVELLKSKKSKSITKNGIETTLKNFQATKMNDNFVIVEISLRFKNQTNKYVHIQLCEYDSPLDDRNLEYSLKNFGLWEKYQQTPDLFDTRLWTKNSDTKIHSIPVVDRPFYYSLYKNKKDGKENKDFNRETNYKFIKPSEYKQEFTLSATCGGEVRGLLGNHVENSTEWISPNESYDAVLRHSVIRGTKPILLQNPDYFEFELDIEPIR